MFGLCLRVLSKCMGWVRSGSRARALMNRERESEVRGGFAVDRAAEMRIVASLRWFEAHRRGIMSLIWFTSSSVRAAPLVAAEVSNSLNGNGGDKKLRDGLRWKKRIFSVTDFMATAAVTGENKAQRKWREKYFFKDRNYVGLCFEKITT